MKRRTFGLMAGTSALAFGFNKRVKAQTVPDASLLGTTLTPFGSEKAGNADGSIPPWTGGYVPGSPDWKEGGIPDFIYTDKAVLTIDASNCAQYADRLSEGQLFLMQKDGYSIQVYPTRRTQTLPQYVCDNIKKNVATAAFVPGGGRLGVTGSYGGIPFPIPDTSDPTTAGAQIIWNHLFRYFGFCQTGWEEGWTISGGVPVLASGGMVYYKNPYYDPNGSLETFDGIFQKILLRNKVPANQNGLVDLDWEYTNTLQHPNQIWELLNGQARVRKAPELEYDTPQALNNDIINYDEDNGYISPANEYDWTYLGKKEMYIPYNNNKTTIADSSTLLLPKFMNPDLVRFELHRVWVVEATLHPGYRNTLARRRYYIDEDTWTIGLIDEYDASNNLYHAGLVLTEIDPGCQANVHQRDVYHNVQTGDWTLNGNFNSHIKFTYDVLPDDMFDPQVIATQSAF